MRDNLRLKDKVAIVTGASGNIGSKIVLTYAQEGADVVVIYHKRQQEAEMLVSAIEDMERKGYALQVDVRKMQEVEQAAKDTYNRFGHIDILVNCAGVVRDKLMIFLLTVDWDYVMETNLTGTFNFCKAVAPYMIKNKQGRIINISSITGIVAQKMRTNYGASKRGVIGLTKCIARELASKGIMVNAICPQVVEGGVSQNASPKELKSIKKITPIGRLGTNNDVAAMALFLASDESKYITGSIINLTGGLITWQI